MKEKVTIKDVAQAAGVAKSTVSRTFAPGQSVATKTREKVLRIAKEMGYVPNPLAQALSRSLTKTVAIVVPNAESVHVSQVTRGVITTFSRAGYSVIIVDASENYGPQTFIRKPLSNQLVDGIINCYSSATEEIMMLSTIKPVVCVGDASVSYKSDFVGIDYTMGYTKLCDYMREKGHERVHFINGQHDEYAVEKSLLFQEIAQGEGLTLADNDIYYANWTPRSGYQVMKKLLLGGEPPRLVACASDMVAFGAMKAIAERGLRIPEDIAVCGMDDSLTSKYTIPALTTLQFSPFRLGRQAARLMLERLKKPDDDMEAKEVILEVNIEKRDSI